MKQSFNMFHLSHFLSFGFLFRATLFIGCCCGFLLQCRESLDKFLGGKTTTVTRLAQPRQSSMLPPTITICADPFLNKTRLQELGLDVNTNPWDYFSFQGDRNFSAWPVTSASDPINQSLWKTTTFSAEDVFEYIRLGDSEHNLQGGAQVREGASWIEYAEISTKFQGVCHSLQIKKKMEAMKPITISLNHVWWENEPQANYKIYLNDPGLEKMAVATSYWLAFPTSENTMSSSKAYDMSYKKHERNSLPDKTEQTCKDWTTEQYLECVRNHMYLINKNRTGCTVPQLVVKRPNVPICHNHSDVEFLVLNERDIWVNVNLYCPMPCSIPYFTTSATAFRIPDGQGTNIWMYYETTDIVLSEEYLLYDFNAIVSAVGGSLGLFLGFSCLDVGGWAAFIWEKVAKKEKNK